jgi:4-methylaminobutanoate oxidase (formaldehyde-forming)
MLNQLSANNVDDQPGLITYTQWLNTAGTLEADLTVTKLDDDRFWVVATDTAHRHVETHLRRHLADGHAFVTDVTGGYAQINIQGPRSRELMAAVTAADLSSEACRSARPEIDLGFASVCIRVTTSASWLRLYIPAEQACIYDRLTAAGAAVGLRHAGLKALGSLQWRRLPDYGHDIDNTDPVLDAGLGFSWRSQAGRFVGRRGAAAKAAGPPTRRLVQVLVTDPEPLLFHAEVVHRDGQPVGYVRSASYGHTLGGAVGLAMVEAGRKVDQAYLDDGDWEVEIAGRRFPAIASIKPLYDPEMKRVRS